MFITPALAQTAGGGTSDTFMSLLPLILIFVVFYFLLIRPQQKKIKQHREMVSTLRRGDRVVTGGGIIGTVATVPEGDEIKIEIAPNVVVHVARGTISDVLSKPQPAESDKPKS